MVSKQVSLGWFLGLFNTLMKVFLVFYIRKQNVPIIFLVSQSESKYMSKCFICSGNTF